MTNLNTEWILWYHDINDTKWTKDRYKKLLDISNLYDYKLLESIIQLNHLQNGMFFLMRKGIFPNWEDPDNTNGVCISFKIPSENLKTEFLNIMLNCISENIFHDPNKYEELNGISIAPKKEFNILKLWMRNKVTNYKNIMKEYTPNILESKCIIKDNNQ